MTRGATFFFPTDCQCCRFQTCSLFLTNRLRYKFTHSKRRINTVHFYLSQSQVITFDSRESGFLPRHSRDRQPFSFRRLLGRRLPGGEQRVERLPPARARQRVGVLLDVAWGGGWRGQRAVSLLSMTRRGSRAAGGYLCRCTSAWTGSRPPRSSPGCRGARRGICAWSTQTASSASLRRRGASSTVEEGRARLCFFEQII